MNDIRIKVISEILEEKAYKMPLPSFIDVTDEKKTASFFNKAPKDIIINWQFILTSITDSLINYDCKQTIQLLFLDLEYAQINKNAITDVCNITQQSLDTIVFANIENQINSIKKLLSEYLHNSQANQAEMDGLINEFNVLITQLETLEVLGIAAFALAASLQLALLQEKARTDSTQWLRVKNLAVEYIKYVKKVNPRLYRLSVGRIDKFCKCTKYKNKEVTEYECRYFNGKDIYVFRGNSEKVGYDCNKHRLTMFQTVVAQVNQTVSVPVRTAIKKWQKLIVRVEEIEARGFPRSPQLIQPNTDINS